MLFSVFLRSLVTFFFGLARMTIGSLCVISGLLMITFRGMLCGRTMMFCGFFVVLCSVLMMLLWHKFVFFCK